MPAFCLLLPVKIAIVTFIALMVTIFTLPLVPRPIEQQLAAWYAIMLVALIWSTLAFPRPLATADLVTDTDETVSGQLVLATDSVWYVGTGGAVIRAVPSDRVECAQIVAHTRRERLIDELRGPPLLKPPAPKLRCGRKPASRTKSKAQKPAAQPRKRAITVK